MKFCTALLLALLVLCLSACERKTKLCPEGSLTYLSDIESFPKLSAVGNPGEVSGPVTVEIRGKPKEVDMLVQGPVCNTRLSGKVYVGCNIQILEWADEPRFLENCDFEVEPGSVVYVAAHNDAVFKKGCGCHRGELNVDKGKGENKSLTMFAE